MKFGSNLENTEEYLPFRYTSGMIRLDANENFQNLSPELVKDFSEILSVIDFNRYPDPYCDGLRNAFAGFYGLSADNLVVGNGSDELISLIFSAMLPHGSVTVTLSPDFSMYSFYPSLYEKDNHIFVKNEDMNFSTDELISFINRIKADFVIFSNPCNPTGQGIAKDMVLKLLQGTNATVCVDEAYMDFWDQENSVMNYVNEYDNLIVLRTLSKMGLASCRLGFAVACRKIISMFNKAKSPYNVNSLSQAAGSLVLSNGKYFYSSVEAIKKSVHDLYKKLSALKLDNFTVFDTHTNFVFCKTPYAVQVYEFLKKRNIIIRNPGREYLRITTGTENENDILIKALEEYRQ